MKRILIAFTLAAALSACAPRWEPSQTPFLTPEMQKTADVASQAQETAIQKITREQEEDRERKEKARNAAISPRAVDLSGCLSLPLGPQQSKCLEDGRAKEAAAQHDAWYAKLTPLQKGQADLIQADVNMVRLRKRELHDAQAAYMKEPTLDNLDAVGDAARAESDAEMTEERDSQPAN
jgi:hypothetical protein